MCIYFIFFTTSTKYQPKIAAGEEDKRKQGIEKGGYGGGPDGRVEEIQSLFEVTDSGGHLTPLAGRLQNRMTVVLTASEEKERRKCCKSVTNSEKIADRFKIKSPGASACLETDARNATARALTSKSDKRPGKY